MTPDQRLLAAIFGGPKAPAVDHWASDRAEAMQIAEQAKHACSFGATAGAEWLPALLYGNPGAVAILAGGRVVKAEVGREGYYDLDEFDIENTEVFND